MEGKHGKPFLGGDNCSVVENCQHVCNINYMVLLFVCLLQSTA